MKSATILLFTYLVGSALSLPVFPVGEGEADADLIDDGAAGVPQAVQDFARMTGWGNQPNTFEPNEGSVLSVPECKDFLVLEVWILPNSSNFENVS